jgi:hypothetical protein
MTDNPPAPRIWSGMREIDRYRRGMELCFENALKAPFNELRAVWQTLGTSYAFLAELHAWPGFGDAGADRSQSARIQSAGVRPAVDASDQ